MKLKVTNAFSISTKNIWPILCGILLGAAWLLPVFQVAIGGGKSFLLTGWSEGRILLIYGISFLMSISFMRVTRAHLSSAAFFIQTVLYIIVPFVSLITFSQDSNGVKYGVAVMILTWATSFWLAGRTASETARILGGIGIVATSLIVYRVTQYGIEFGSYYARQRAHFGFFHPIDTASAFVAILTATIALGSTKNPWRLSLTLGFCAFSLAGIFLAGSRNICLFTGISISGAAFLFLMRARSRTLKTLVFVSLGLLPSVISIALITTTVGRSLEGLSPDPGSSISHRLNGLQVMRILLKKTDIQYFSAVRGYAESPSTKGFAVYDSVYLSYLHYFGIVGLIIFILMWSGIGSILCRLSRRANVIDYWCAGTWLGLSVFYTFDAQGFTISNLALFLPLTFFLSRSGAASKTIMPKAQNK